jgi:hypothetical protein
VLEFLVPQVQQGVVAWVFQEQLEQQDLQEVSEPLEARESMGLLETQVLREQQVRRAHQV